MGLFIKRELQRGHVHYGKPIGKSNEQRRGILFLWKKKWLKGVVLNKVH